MRECDLLEHIYQANTTLPQTVTIPPGDDMAAVRFCRMSALVTVDQIADGVHFDSAKTPIEKIGRKAITRNLSDVAAMAAMPVGAVVAGCLPRDLGKEQANKLFDTMRCVAESHQCPLIGGDITIWDRPLVLTVTVIASPDGIRPLLRSSATVGAAYSTPEPNALRSVQKTVSTRHCVNVLTIQYHSEWPNHGTYVLLVTVRNW